MCAVEADDDLIGALVAAHNVLRDSDVEHVLGGGIAANFYRDELRTTTDVDIYIICATPEIVSLTRTFEEKGWRAHPVWGTAELLRLERDDLPRVDLLIAVTDFEKDAVRRAIQAPIAGEDMAVLRAEDLIVFKLVAGRARDYEAAAAIINTQGTELDSRFIQGQLAELGMEDRWFKALKEAELEAQDGG